MPAVLSGRAVNGPVFSDLLGLKEVPKLEVEKFGSCNVPSYVFEPCDRQEESQQRNGVRIVGSFPASGVFRYENVPPACLELFTILGGSCNVVTVRPTSCGTACIQWAGLSDKEMALLKEPK
ncbi:hypothetical protein K4K49_002798 [Colletotrichum sp. SAR 10_70]|nr:hypothetical protein K4K50_007388 [Colletotrichum sp. SAR 10_71]KAI8166037.1 hypothetical protein KHU50_006881 [Colletotrichum sp. SAR 10_65]KAI8174442.1 hypothetical protein K4K49_002798 [Colletotrichum sp. SAR 10_70]KAJ4997052.1 hypothetical protein K4K48_007460 [Colletotrichum sp. SAR 10_66]